MSNPNLKKEEVCVYKVYRLTNYDLYTLFINADQAVFILPEERTTGLGCIPDGTTVNYQCTVMDDGSRVTVWLVSAFNCSGSPPNALNLLHAAYTTETSATCGDLSGMSVGVDGTNYTSILTVTANTGLDGTLINCTRSTVLLVGYDAIRVGGWVILFGFILLDRICIYSW